MPITKKRKSKRKARKMPAKPKISPTYWADTGRYQELQQTLYTRLVGPAGKASTMHGELLRAINRIYYDVYNNGFCNADMPMFAYAVNLLAEWDTEITSALMNNGHNPDTLKQFLSACRKHIRACEKSSYVAAKWEGYAMLEKIMDAVIITVDEVCKRLDAPVGLARFVWQVRDEQKNVLLSTVALEQVYTAINGLKTATEVTVTRVRLDSLPAVSGEIVDFSGSSENFSRQWLTHIKEKIRGEDAEDEEARSLQSTAPQQS